MLSHQHRGRLSKYIKFSLCVISQCFEVWLSDRFSVGYLFRSEKRHSQIIIASGDLKKCTNLGSFDSAHFVYQIAARSNAPVRPHISGNAQFMISDKNTPIKHSIQARHKLTNQGGISTFKILKRAKIIKIAFKNLSQTNKFEIQYIIMNFNQVYFSIFDIFFTLNFQPYKLNVIGPYILMIFKANL